MNVIRKNINTIPAIQYLRGIAALMVVFFHASPHVRNYIGWSVLAWGEFGVDIFFNISGFVMMYSVISTEIRVTFINFVKNRLVRIGPMYWLMTTLMTLTLIIMPTAFNSAVLSLSHYSMSMLFIPHFHPGINGAVLPMLVLGWTLCYEMYFYIIFGVTLAVPKPYIFISTLCLLAIISIFSICGFFGNSAVSVFLNNSIIYEFSCGMLIALLYRSNILMPKRLAIIAMPISFGLVIFASSVDNRFFTAGILSTIILYSSLSFSLSINKRVTSFLRLLGDS